MNTVTTFAVTFLLITFGWTLGMVTAGILASWRRTDELEEAIVALERIYSNGNRP